MTEQLAATAAWHVVGNVRCVGCGYALLGLPIGGVCPECSCAVSDSLSTRPFGFLSDGDARQLRRGIRCVLAAVAVVVCGAFVIPASIFLTNASSSVIADVLPKLSATLVAIAAATCWSAGWFLITRVDPPAAAAPVARSAALMASWLQVGVFVVLPSMVFGGANPSLLGGVPISVFAMLITGSGWLGRLVERSNEDSLMGTLSLVDGFSTGAAIAVAVAVVAVTGGFWYLGMMFLTIAAIPMIGALLTWWSFLHGMLGALDRRLRDSTRP